MKKQVLGFWFVFLLVGSLVMTAPGTAAADYVIVVKTNNTDAVVSYLNSTWTGYVPQFSYSVDANAVTITASSMQDYIRLLLPRDYTTTTTLFDYGNVTGTQTGKLIFVAGDINDAEKSVTVSISNSIIADVFIEVIYYDSSGTHAGVYDAANTSNAFVELTAKGQYFDSVALPSDFVVRLADTYYVVNTKGVVAVFVPTDQVLSSSLSVSANSGGYVYEIPAPTYPVTVSIKDALTGQSLTDVTVKDEYGNALGTVDDGGVVYLTEGNHTLTFEKTGYWTATATVEVIAGQDASVYVEMYPDSAAFMFKNFPVEIKAYENQIYELSFVVSPIDTSATYNTYLSISGLDNILEVRKDGSLVSPEGGKYSLGDVADDVYVTIKFKAPTGTGTHSFTLSLESNDALMTKSYTTTKSVVYEVQALPFSVQVPQEWSVGANTIRISESAGQNIVVTLVLKSVDGTEVWSDSYALSPYEAHTFTANVPAEGNYLLEISFDGNVVVYDVAVSPLISLVSKTIEAEKGQVAAVTLHIKNPSDLTKYYKVVLSGGFIEGNVTKDLAIAPYTEKDVEIAFQVPSELDYDAYDLKVQVLEGDSVLFEDVVHVIITEGSFSLFGGSGDSSTFVYAGVGLAALLGLFAVIRLRRR